MKHGESCRWPVLAAVGLLVLLLTLYLSFGSPGWAASEPVILDGIKIDGLDVGGLTGAEAEKKLQRQIRELEKVRISLLFRNREFSFTYKELGVSVPTAKLIQKALDYGRAGSLWQQLRQRWRLRRKGVNFPLLFEWDQSRLTGLVRELATEINTSPEDAHFHFSGDMVEIIPQKLGRKLDVSRTVSDITRVILLKGRGYVRVSTHPVFPRVTTADLRQKGITSLMAKYTTLFNPYNKPRVANIKLAAVQLDNVEIAPGETFSFNETVGPRTRQRGFQEALIIVDNEFRSGVGGGVCQVSSTLYNAVLRANLPVAERQRHSLLVTYVPLGLDATVSYGHIDFKFINNTDSHIMIKTGVAGDRLTIKLFGSPRPVRVELKSVVERIIPYETVVREDAGIPAGKTFLEQKGKEGYQVRVEKRIIQEGKVVSYEVVSRDRYPAVNEIVRVGTGKPGL